MIPSGVARALRIHEPGEDMKALLNRPSAALAECELTYLVRDPIDVETARRQHEAYAQALRAAGADVCVLAVNEGCPDGVFVEDVAVVLDEVALVTTMGTASRRAEIPALRRAIAEHREVVDMTLPATLEGGDVLRVGRTLFAGLSSRTNREGVAALEAVAAPLGYTIVPVEVPGALHLKTCITALDDETCLVNRAWLDLAPFGGFRLIDVDPAEPWGANVLRLGRDLVMNAASPATVEIVRALGYPVRVVNISEFGKAEAGLTCMSLLFAG
jgi:dimethylargininase